jgi:hypothetical protein
MNIKHRHLLRQNMKNNVNSIEDDEPMNHKMFWNRMGMKDDE